MEKSEKRRITKTNIYLGILILMSLILLITKNPNVLIFSFFISVIFSSLVVKIIFSKLKKECREKNFTKAGLYTIKVSLILLAVILINHYFFLRMGDPFEHSTGVYFILGFFLLGLLILASVSIITGAFSVEKNKISNSKK